MPSLSSGSQTNTVVQPIVSSEYDSHLHLIEKYYRLTRTQNGQLMSMLTSLERRLKNVVLFQIFPKRRIQCLIVYSRKWKREQSEYRVSNIWRYSRAKKHLDRLKSAPRITTKVTRRGGWAFWSTGTKVIQVDPYKDHTVDVQGRLDQAKVRLSVDLKCVLLWSEAFVHPKISVHI